MNLTLNKKVKTLVALLLCVCMCFVMCSCTKSTKDIDDTDQVCISGSYSESWMNVFADKEFVKKMVEIYNGVRYEKTDEAVDMMSAGGCFIITYSEGSKKLATFIVDKNNNCTFEAGTQSYHIVSDFDFDEMKKLIMDMREATTATPDQANK